MEKSRKERGAALGMWIVCGGLFALFCFSFLYVMQADFLTAVQHVLSKGKTVYSPFWGALIVTVLLSLVPLLAAGRAVLPTWATAFLYFPSCLCLALLTGVRFSAEGTCVWGSGWWWGLPVLAAYLLALHVLKQIPEFSYKSTVWGRLWPNALLMTLFFGMVGVCANTDIRLHNELKTARYLQEEDYVSALSVGHQSLEVSRRLTAMRCYALSRTGQLGDRLFEYPMPYGSLGLLPSSADSVGLVRWPGAFYQYVGARPSARLEGSPTVFFRLLAGRPGPVTPARADYLLCSYLLDKNLDAFVGALPSYYAIDEQLPRSYKEALILYAHLRMTPVLVYQDAVLQANYEEYQGLRRVAATDAERYKACRRLYGSTYWFYYHFQ